MHMNIEIDGFIGYAIYTYVLNMSLFSSYNF